MEEDRSALFNQLKNFSQRKLKKVETKVVTASGEQLVEKRGAKGLQVLSGGGDGSGSNSNDAEPARKLDLQVGLVMPGFLIASQDVSHDKSSLDTYGVTHILNLDSGVENKFEDDYNYKNVAMQDKPDFELDRVLDDCFEFIDDGRHYGNVLVHCSGTTGLSRSTTICIAYLMNKDNQKLDEAFNNVKEVRSFVRPNEGFIKQLKDYEVKLRGAQKVKESGIDDPFALRKKQEIEQEKAMVAGAASVKNRMKMFGATLDTNAAAASNARSKSVSPSPNTLQSSSSSNNQNNTPTPTSNKTSKWAPVSTDTNSRLNASKSMTPEPKKSWQTQTTAEATSKQPDWRKSSSNQQSAGGPPPPPPPMPSSSLHDNDKSVKPLRSAGLPPPPPPPPVDLLKNDRPSTTTHRKQSVSSEASGDDDAGGKKVFGRRPPPPMKIRGGVSIERQDSTSDKNQGYTTNKTNTQSPSLETVDVTTRARAFSNLEQQQQQLNQRCASPLVLMNNVNQLQSARVRHGNDNNQAQDPSESPFKYWQQQQQARKATDEHTINSLASPKRTISLGPRRPVQIGDSLKKSPFLQDKPPSPAAEQLERRFNKATKELQSSLTELNKLIDSRPSSPQISSNTTTTTRPNLVPSSTPLTFSDRPPRFVSTSNVSTASGGTTKNNNNNLPTINLIQRQQSVTADNSPEDNRANKWQWQDDLDNWKSSSSVNDLRSMFDQPKLKPLPDMVGAAGRKTLGEKPPLSASSNVMSKKSLWLSQAAAAPNDNNSPDYTIRRTISTSSSKPREPPRNPYRNTNWG